MAADTASIDAVGIPVLSKSEDVANARLRFANGCVANLNASRVSPTARREMQVWTDYGFCVIDFAGRKAEVSAVTACAMRGEIDWPESLRRRVKALAGLDEDCLGRVYSERLRFNKGAEKHTRRLVESRHDVSVGSIAR